MKNSMILAGVLLAASLSGCIAVTGVHEVRVGQTVVADFGPLGTAHCVIRPQAAA